MRITDEDVARLLAVRFQHVQHSGPSPSDQHINAPRRARSQPDRALVSSLLEDIRACLAAASSSIRAEHPRLASLAAQIREGRYRISSERIADALLREFRGA